MSHFRLIVQSLSEVIVELFGVKSVVNFACSIVDNYQTIISHISAFTKAFLDKLDFTVYAGI